GKEDHAVQAAIAVIEAVKKNNARRQTENQEPLMIGIGLNCGEVVVGNMGSRDRMDFTAIGDAVNLAARLCSAAEPLQVLASENMLRGAKQKYAGKKLDPIRVKGKEKPIQVFDIRGLSKGAAAGNGEPVSIA
ncbi:MAG: adenylate/guanylate cyclase domain-containing protein, partial [Spirochaetia bacterium]|nr:adenylate/guanylate cyclase domain-containing protein [Spirochaetia bacterium]